MVTTGTGPETVLPRVVSSLLEVNMVEAAESEAAYLEMGRRLRMEGLARRNSESSFHHGLSSSGISSSRRRSSFYKNC